VKSDMIDGFGYIKSDIWSSINSGFFGDADTKDSRIQNIIDPDDAEGKVSGIRISSASQSY